MTKQEKNKIKEEYKKTYKKYLKDKKEAGNKQKTLMLGKITGARKILNQLNIYTQGLEEEVKTEQKPDTEKELEKIAASR